MVPRLGLGLSGEVCRAGENVERKKRNYRERRKNLEVSTGGKIPGETPQLL